MVERIDAEAARYGRADESFLDGTVERALRHVASQVRGCHETESRQETRRGVQCPDCFATQGCANGVAGLLQGGHARSAGEQEQVRHHGEVAAEALVAPPREADAAIGLLISLEPRPALGCGPRANAHECSSAAAVRR